MQTAVLKKPLLKIAKAFNFQKHPNSVRVSGELPLRRVDDVMPPNVRGPRRSGLRRQHGPAEVRGGGGVRVRRGVPVVRVRVRQGGGVRVQGSGRRVPPGWLF